MVEFASLILKLKSYLSIKIYTEHLHRDTSAFPHNKLNNNNNQHSLTTNWILYH